MNDTTENMAPCDACRWYYNNKAAGREMECKGQNEHDQWIETSRYFYSYFTYRLKQWVLQSGAWIKRGPASVPINWIEDPGPDAVVLSSMPTEADLHQAIMEAAGTSGSAVLELLQLLKLEVKRD